MGCGCSKQALDDRDVTDAAMTFRKHGPGAEPVSFTDESGVVTWMGMRWYGVPWILRPGIAWDYARDQRPDIVDKLPGCGCWVWLKDLTTRLGVWADGSNHTA